MFRLCMHGLNVESIGLPLYGTTHNLWYTCIVFNEHITTTLSSWISLIPGLTSVYDSREELELLCKKLYPRQERHNKNNNSKKATTKKTHKYDLLLVHPAQLIELFAYMETELCQWRSRIQFGKGRGVINTFTLRVAEGGQYMTAIGTNYNSSMWSSLGEAPANLVFYRVHFRYIWKNHTFVSIYADLYSKM